MTYSIEACRSNNGEFKGTILRFDNATLLLDPGWNGSTSFDKFKEFWSEYIVQVDIILISQPTLECLGSYAVIFSEFLAHFKSRIQVFGTLPVCNLGRVNSLDFLISAGIVGPYKNARMDLEDVEGAFDSVQTVKYSQTIDMKNSFEGLKITAHNSGYAPGGTIWSIATYSEKILYAPRWNHTRDTILNSADLLDKSGNPTSSLMRPTSVITNTDILGSSEPQRKRVEHFYDTMKRSLQFNSSILIPVEIGGKLLEILALINNFLYENKKDGLRSDIHVLLLSYSRGRSITYAKSMLEWLSSQVVKTWESRDNRSPFDLISRLKIIRVNEINSFSGVKICLVSEAEDLLSQAINRLCTKEKVTTILTEKNVNLPADHPLQKLYGKWEQAVKSGSRSALDGNAINFSDSMALKIPKTTILDKKEMEEIRTQIEARNAERNTVMQELQKKEQETNESLFNDESSDEEEDLDVLNPNKRKATAAVKIEIPVDTIIQTTASAKQQMFQFYANKVKNDDYGEVVDFASFLPQEESYGGVQTKKHELDDDGYNINGDSHDSQGSRKISKKRKLDNAKQQSENYDDLSYLDPLKNDIYKRSLEKTKTNVRCSLVLIDLTSVVNARSTTIIWSSLKPRKLLSLPSVLAESSSILENLQKRSIDAVSMKASLTIEVDTAIKAFDISIDPTLDHLLKWQKISREYSVAHVVGRLIREKDPKSHREKMILQPSKNQLALHSHSSLRIGDVRLPELKRRLTAENHKAEFQGEGILVVDGKVLVRKINEAETIVDGSPSEVFYKVKSAVADMLASV